jgi:hypothetical protein
MVAEIYRARLKRSLRRAEFIPLLAERNGIRSTTNLPARGITFRSPGPPPAVGAGSRRVRSVETQPPGE